MGHRPREKNNKILIATIAETLSIIALLIYYFRIRSEIVSIVQPCTSPCFLRNAIFCSGRSRLWLLRYPAFSALRGEQLKNTSTQNHQAVNPTQSQTVQHHASFKDSSNSRHQSVHWFCASFWNPQTYKSRSYRGKYQD